MTGTEKFTFHIAKDLKIGMTIKVTTDTGLSFNVKARLDTEPEIEYYKVGGILIYVMKRIMNQK